MKWGGGYSGAVCTPHPKLNPTAFEWCKGSGGYAAASNLNSFPQPTHHHTHTLTHACPQSLAIANNLADVTAKAGSQSIAVSTIGE
jgi:hypothetical protein